MLISISLSIWTCSLIDCIFSSTVENQRIVLRVSALSQAYLIQNQRKIFCCSYSPTWCFPKEGLCFLWCRYRRFPWFLLATTFPQITTSSVIVSGNVCLKTPAPHIFLVSLQQQIYFTASRRGLFPHYEVKWYHPTRQWDVPRLWPAATNMGQIYSDRRTNPHDRQVAFRPHRFNHSLPHRR